MLESPVIKAEKKGGHPQRRSGDKLGRGHTGPTGVVLFSNRHYSFLIYCNSLYCIDLRLWIIRNYILHARWQPCLWHNGFKKGYTNHISEVVSSFAVSLIKLFLKDFLKDFHTGILIGSTCKAFRQAWLKADASLSVNIRKIRCIHLHLSTSWVPSGLGKKCIFNAFICF